MERTAVEHHRCSCWSLAPGCAPHLEGFAQECQPFPEGKLATSSSLQTLDWGVGACYVASLHSLGAYWLSGYTAA